MASQTAFSIKENWYWIGPIVGGIMATCCPFIKERFEEILYKHRFKKNYLSLITASVFELFEYIENKNINNIIKQLHKIIKYLLYAEKDILALRVRYVPDYLYILLELKEIIDTVTVMFESNKYSGIQKKEIIDNIQINVSKETIQIHVDPQAKKEILEYYNAINSIYTCIQALK